MKVHLDTDIGGDIDDLCALAMLLGWSGVEVVGITRWQRMPVGEPASPGGRSLWQDARIFQLLPVSMSRLVSFASSPATHRTTCTG
jgi:hypothetical protein